MNIFSFFFFNLTVTVIYLILRSYYSGALYVRTTAARCNEDGGFIGQNQYTNCARYRSV